MIDNKERQEIVNNLRSSVELRKVGRMNNGARVRSRVHGADTRTLIAGNLIANMTTNMNAHIAENHSLLR